MRLLFLTGRFPEVSETFIWREAQSFLATGTARVVSLEGNAFEPELFPPEVARVVASTDYRRLSIGEALAVVREALRSPRAVLGLVRFLAGFYPLPRCLSRVYATLRVRSIARKADIEVVHAHWRGPTDVAYLLNRLDGTPYSVFLHAHDIYDEGLAEARYRLLFETKLKHASAVFTCTAANVRCLLQAIPGSAPQLCYHGISGTAYTEGTMPEPRASARTLRLITVGRLVSYKGFEDVPELARLMAARGIDFTWELIGDGSLRQSLETEIERRGLAERVLLRGALSNRDVLERVRQSDIFVFLGKQERGQYGLPNVLIEAAASGACIVSRKIDTLEEVIEPGSTGFAAADLDSCAAVIERLYRDRRLLSAVAARARRQISEHHCHETNFSEMCRRIRSALLYQRSCRAGLRGAA